MEIVRYPDKTRWDEILKRPHFDNSSLVSTVSAVLEIGRAHV